MLQSDIKILYPFHRFKRANLHLHFDLVEMKFTQKLGHFLDLKHNQIQLNSSSINGY